MSSNSLVVEELLIKSIEAQNRTTHALRAIVSFILLLIIFGVVAAGLLWLAIGANGGVVLMTAGIVIALLGFVLGLISAFYQLFQSGKGLRDDVNQFVDALDSVK